MVWFVLIKIREYELEIRQKFRPKHNKTKQNKNKKLKQVHFLSDQMISMITSHTKRRFPPKQICMSFFFFSLPYA